MVSLHGHPSNGLLETVKGVFPKRTQGEPGTLHTNWDSYPKDRTPLHEKGTLIVSLIWVQAVSSSLALGGALGDHKGLGYMRKKRGKRVFGLQVMISGVITRTHIGVIIYFSCHDLQCLGLGAQVFLLSGLKLISSCLSQEAPSPAAGSRWIFCCHSRPRSQSLAQTPSAFLSSCTLVSWR